MPTGHALPLGPSFGLREPNGWMPRINSGHPIPALRPEQSDHVPWADCPQGLSSTSVRCAHPPGKSPLLPIFERGSSQCRAQTSWRANSSYRARSCSLFSSFKKGKAFSLRCLSPLCSPAVGAGQAYPLRGGMLRFDLRIFATQKASVKSKSCWPLQRAMRPVAEWRSESAKRQGAAPDPRAARPVAERR